MGYAEHNIIVEYIKKAGMYSRMFRSNSGMAWAGKIVSRDNEKNTITIKNPRVFHGMPEGFPDTVGFQSVTVTPEMVGKRIAIFKCAEFKTGNQKLTYLQSKFKKMVDKMGGIFEVVRG